MRLHELFVNKGEVDEGDVVDISTPMPAEFINWLITKDLPISILNDFAKMRELIEYEKETGRKIQRRRNICTGSQTYATNQKCLKKYKKQNS